MTRCLVLFIIFGCMLLAPAHAADDAAREFARLQAEQKKIEAAEKALAEKLAQSQQNLTGLQERLINATTREVDMNRSVTSLATRKGKLAAEVGAHEASLRSRHGELGSMLVALSRMGRMPPALMLLNAESSAEAVRAGLLIKTAVPVWQSRAQSLKAELENLNNKRTALAEEESSLRTAMAQLRKSERTELDDMIRTRQAQLNLSQSEREALRAHQQKLANEAQNVQELLQKVATPMPFVSKAARLQFGLRAPVDGTLVRAYGQKDDAGVESQGLSYKVAPGSRISAPASGRVMFAGPFRGYGDIIILEHDGDQHSMITGFERIDVEKGQKLKVGEPLGVAGSSAKTRNEIYFEFRRDGAPVDPRSATNRST